MGKILSLQLEHCETNVEREKTPLYLISIDLVLIET